MIRYFTLVTWEVCRAGESLASQCATVSFCALGRYFYFGFLRAMFSRPEFSSQVTTASLCLLRGRVNQTQPRPPNGMDR